MAKKSHIEKVKRLRSALREAEAGLCFAGADQRIAKDRFVPAPTLALRIVRRALRSR